MILNIIFIIPFYNSFYLTAASFLPLIAGYSADGTLVDKIESGARVATKCEVRDTK